MQASLTRCKGSHGLEKPATTKPARTKVAKPGSRDRTREAEGKAGFFDAQLRQTFGPAKDAPHKA